MKNCIINTERNNEQRYQIGNVYQNRIEQYNINR